MIETVQKLSDDLAELIRKIQVRAEAAPSGWLKDSLVETNEWLAIGQKCLAEAAEAESCATALVSSLEETFGVQG